MLSVKRIGIFVVQGMLNIQLEARRHFLCDFDSSIVQGFPDRFHFHNAKDEPCLESVHCSCPMDWTYNLLLQEDSLRMHKVHMPQQETGSQEALRLQVFEHKGGVGYSAA